jgi:hypothetical protein
MKALTVGAATLVALASVWDLAVTLRGEPDEVSVGTIRKAADIVRASLRPGDLILHSPLFGMEALKGLGGLDATPAFPDEETSGSHRVWVIDRHPISPFVPRTPSEVDRLEGGVEVRRHEPVFAQSRVYDLAESLTPETMTLEFGSRRVRCKQPRSEGGFECPGQPEWLYVAKRSLAIEGGKFSVCVWAHPAHSQTVVLTLPALPVAEPDHSLWLRVSGAMTQEAVRGTPDGGPVHTDIDQGSIDQPARRLGRLTVPNQVGWFVKDIPVQAGLPVHLRVSAPRDGRRHHCLRAEVRSQATAIKSEGEQPP